MDKYDALKLDNQLCFPLYAAAREIIKQYHEPLQAIDLTYTQYIAMMVLWEEKEITTKALGTRLHLDSGTLTPMLKKLETKGYLIRKRSKEDERILIVSITEQGEKLKEQAVKIPSQMAGCVNLSKEEALQLYQLLYKLLSLCSEIS